MRFRPSVSARFGSRAPQPEPTYAAAAMRTGPIQHPGSALGMSCYGHVRASLGLLFGRFDGYILQTVTEPAPLALRRKLTLGDVTIAVVTGAIFLGALAVRSRLVFAIVV